MKNNIIKTEPNQSPFKDTNLLANSELIGKGKDFEYETCSNEFEMMIDKNTELLFLKEIPIEEEMSKIYPENYYTNHETTKTRHILDYFRNKIEKKKISTLLENLDQGKTLNILDLGSGDGRFLSLIEKYSDQKHNFYGIEISLKASEISRKKGFNIITGNLENVCPTEWETKFDLIIAHQLIEHMRYPDKLLEKCHKWLKVDGLLSIETPDFCGWDYTLFKKRYWGGWHFPRHFFIFSRSSLIRLSKIHGYKIVSVKSILSVIPWILSLHNLFSEISVLRRIKHLIWYDSVLCLVPATIIEVLQKLLGFKSSNFQLIIKK
jgi:SAM-dependent methyltransferase